MAKIADVHGRQILDSRGIPTVEVDVKLADGALGRAAVPAGTSTGGTEAVELRDGDNSRFWGQSVDRAVQGVCGEIRSELIGRDHLDQETLDRTMIELDGTGDKSRLGSNAILGVSLAFTCALAQSKGVPVYHLLANGNDFLLPVPMLNIINGGRHALNSTDFQEFMVVPAGFDTFSQALRAGAEVYHYLGQIFGERGFGRSVGYEGGFTPAMASNVHGMELILQAIDRAGYEAGKQCFIAIDTAATELRTRKDIYALHREEAVLSAAQLINMYERWSRDYPLISIEDGMAEDDWDEWSLLNRLIGNRVQLVGDDLYTANLDRIRLGIEQESSNAVLIKPNQTGTVSETIEAVNVTKSAGWGTVVSHRSGETEDVTIADIAVGTAAGQIKAGAPARSDRTAKYNRLLRIEEELGDQAKFAGAAVYERFLS